MNVLKRGFALLFALLLCASVAFAESEGGKVTFSYRLTLTDQDGREIVNPRTLSAGDRVNVEIELKRDDPSVASYETYGMEFRLESRGLEYNHDGASFRNGTAITKQVFDSGDSVGFAFYDMERKGERVNNPVLAGRWGYTVEDPGEINITVPVALLYVVGGSDSIVPVGNARLYLDPNGGQIDGVDVSGEYPSGTIVTLPDASFAEYVFKGWSDGVRLYQAGDNFTVTGIVTLTAQWEGMVRNRQVIFDPKGGEFAVEDPSGMYADGQVIPMPRATLDGFILLGWRMGDENYRLHDNYTVDNSVIFTAQWLDRSIFNYIQYYWQNDAMLIGTAVGTGAGVIFLWWLLLLLWRRYVRYSLLDGGVLLSYRDMKHVSSVEVYLDRDGETYLLDHSDDVDRGKKLKQINGEYVLLGLKKGFYKGHLHVTYTDGKEPRDIEVRIHALKKEYNVDKEER